MKHRHVFYARHSNGIKLTIEQAYQTHCPLCGARPGDPCRYVAQPALKNRKAISPAVQAKQNRFGEPTQRPHAPRFYSEQLRLGLWLAEHAHILWE